MVGAGAIGGFFGARLARGFADVSVLARGATLLALQRDGWVLESGGARQAAPVRAVADARDLPVQDIVLIAVKAHALAQVAPRIGSLIGPDTVVVPALNGVPWWFTLGQHGLPVDGALRSTDPTGAIERAVPIASIVGAVVYPACTSPAPGVARHHSGSKVVLGDATGSGAAPSARVQALVTLLRHAGFDADGSGDIRTEVWKKLLGNACFNPVSMLTGTATDLLIDDPDIHALFVRMMQETLAVGAALGLQPQIDPVARIALTRKLGNIKTSMLQDAEAGRPIELDAILGALVELGRRTGVQTAALDTVLALARVRAATFGLLQQA